MGEPLHNYESVMAAVDIMCHPLGLHMSHNKVLCLVLMQGSMTLGSMTSWQLLPEVLSEVTLALYAACIARQ
jgi:adenine C2-methylase RlmN of 23S rRNA A2503 and tRNA A37